MAMTVKQLKQLLEKVDDTRIVIIAKDAEGNEYSPLAGHWQGAYQAESEWAGTAGLERLTKADRERGYTDEDVVEGVPALILTPVN